VAGDRVAAIVLAAGLGRRMGGLDKLLLKVGGRPLVRIAADAALASRARPVVVVTGHHADAVAAAIAGLDIRVAHNADYAAGMSTSLRTGLDALPEGIAGAAVLLADMPAVDGGLIDRLVAAFAAAEGNAIVVPTHDGQRGNPVVWPARLFANLREISGDTGGRQLLIDHREAVLKVEVGAPSGLDLDTAEDFNRIQPVRPKPV
jgi:molybdenum cofactor cytidylyltransferase